jgi:hypothetical protein
MKMSFLPDECGDNVASVANAHVAEFCLREQFLARKALKVCGCRSCEQIVEDAEDRIQWSTSTGDWDQGYSQQRRHKRR